MSKERGEELAIEYGIKFMETSAKASVNVEEAFFTLAKDIKVKMEKKLVSPFFGKFNEELSIVGPQYLVLKKILFFSNLL